MKSLRVALLAATFVSAAACSPPGSSSGALAPQGSPSRSADADLGPMLPPIQIDELAPGDGPAAKKGDRVRVHYTGTLQDGTKFDSSLDRGTPFEFVLGERAVIEGWDLGVVGMKKGSQRRLTIPPHLAYGSRGVPPRIPPEATLVFVVELVEVL